HDGSRLTGPGLSASRKAPDRRHVAGVPLSIAAGATRLSCPSRSRSSWQALPRRRTKWCKRWLVHLLRMVAARGAHLFDDVAAGSLDMAGDGRRGRVGILCLDGVENFLMLAHHGYLAADRDRQPAADGAQDLAMLPPEIDRV